MLIVGDSLIKKLSNNFAYYLSMTMEYYIKNFMKVTEFEEIQIF